MGSSRRKFEPRSTVNYKKEVNAKMDIIEIFFIGVGLAMDAFSVSVCKGLSMKKLDIKKALIIAIYFGVFQGIMPLIGYFLGSTFESLISEIDHWIAFALLEFIGINMIREAFGDENKNANDKIDFKTMIILAVATSIDALTVGVTFAFFNVNILLAAFIIAIVTFALSLVGVKIGNRFGNKYESKAEIIGGIILAFMGLKILIEHLFFLEQHTFSLHL